MKKKTIIACILLVQMWAAGFDVNPKLENLDENEWMILDTAGSINLAESNYFAYSGGTYDRTNHQFLVFGGGHWDGWKNDIIAFDIATDTWKSMYTPDPSSSYKCSNVNTATPGMLLDTKMPASRHTYDQIEFMDHIGKLIMWAGPTYSGIWSCPGNTIPADTWLYDYATNTWEYKNTSRQSQPADEAACGAYDPVGKIYYALHNGATWIYVAEADKWTKLNPTGSAPNGYDRSIITDRKRQKLWIWPHSYDIKTNTWTSHSGGPGGLDECSYDEVNDVLIFLGSSGLHIYDIADDRWETKSQSNYPGKTRAYQRFFYDPVDNVHLYVIRANYRPQTWAYRYKGGVPVSTAKNVNRNYGFMVLVAPNPFKPVTTIAVECKMQNVKCKMQILNIQGQIVHEFQKSNGNCFTWNAANHPAGVYILKIQAGARIITKKLFLQK